MWFLFSTSTTAMRLSAHSYKKVFHSGWQCYAVRNMPGISYKYRWASEAEIYPSTESTFLKCQILSFSSLRSLNWPQGEILVSKDLVLTSHHYTTTEGGSGIFLTAVVPKMKLLSSILIVSVSKMGNGRALGTLAHQFPQYSYEDWVD